MSALALQHRELFIPSGIKMFAEQIIEQCLNLVATRFDLYPHIFYKKYVKLLAIPFIIFLQHLLFFNSIF